MKSFQGYISNDSFFSQEFLFDIDPADGISWWKFIAKISEHENLSKIALRLLHIQPTNTAVKRSFSQKFIHRKERNLLSQDRVNKLMYIHSNINFKNGTFDIDFKKNFVPKKSIANDQDDDAVILGKVNDIANMDIYSGSDGESDSSLIEDTLFTAITQVD